MYNRKKTNFRTIRGLILSGSDKITPDALKNPTLTVGFKDDKPKLSTYFNIVETRGLRGEELRKQSLHLILDYNIFIVFIERFKSLLEYGEDKIETLTISDTKFIDNQPTKELEVKGVVKFGIEGGNAIIMISNPAGVEASFGFRNPYRGKFYNNGDDINVSISYANGWLDSFKESASLVQLEFSEE